MKKSILLFISIVLAFVSCKAVIDVDSRELNAFNATDRRHLEHIAAMLSESGLL